MKNLCHSFCTVLIICFWCFFRRNRFLHEWQQFFRNSMVSINLFFLKLELYSSSLIIVLVHTPRLCLSEVCIFLCWNYCRMCFWCSLTLGKPSNFWITLRMIVYIVTYPVVKDSDESDSDEVVIGSTRSTPRPTLRGEICVWSVLCVMRRSCES